MSARISRGHVLIAAAVLVAGIIVAYVAETESCDDWRKRYTIAIDALDGHDTDADIANAITIRDERPKGC